VSNTITFDLDRMGNAAHALYETRTRMEALSQRTGRIDADAVKDPAMRAYLSAGGRRLELMLHGDAGELAAVEHSVRGAMRRALAADSPSRPAPGSFRSRCRSTGSRPDSAAPQARCRTSAGGQITPKRS
jgi:hypothetical protein